MNACKKLLEAIFYNDNLLEVAEDMVAFSESALTLREPFIKRLRKPFIKGLPTPYRNSFHRMHLQSTSHGVSMQSTC